MSHLPLELEHPGPGLHVLTGPNGAGKSWAARELAAKVPGAALLSAESQQAFYEAELAHDESNFQDAPDTGTRVSELLGAQALAHPLFAAFQLEPLWHRGYRLLSTGESRKVLLLRALLRGPSLLVLDDPFDGLDASSAEQLSQALVTTAEQVPVLLVGGFGAEPLPVPNQAVKSVLVLEDRALAFHGTLEAWRARSGNAGGQLAPPVELGSHYSPLPPHVPLVDLRQGRVQYGDQLVFKDLSFRVMQGQHTLIEGPNGSGKSTLVELVTGDHPQAYSNELYLFGRRRGSGETVWDIKKNVGLVSARLHRDYRVNASLEDVLVSGLYDSIGLYLQPEPSDRARARAWLSWLALGVKAETAFRSLSFGQQRLLLIARAAIKAPPLVVLDEPTSGLDGDNRARALALVASLCTQQRSTVLLVTHRSDERAFWESRIGGARVVLGAVSTPDNA